MRLKLSSKVFYLYNIELEARKLSIALKKIITRLNLVKI